MPTTGAPGNIWYPDDTAPIAPLENLFLTLATSVNVALAAYDASLNKIIVVASPAALDAVTTSKVGDLAWMTTPGTGIDPMLWVAYGGTGAGLDWHPVGRVVAASKANLDSFIAVIAGITDTRFQIGGEAIVTASGVIYRFTSAVGAYVGKLTGLIASGTLSAVSAFNIDGLTGADDYEITIKLPTASVANDLSLVLRNNGTPDSSSNYDRQSVVGSTTTSTAANAMGANSWSSLLGAARLRKTIILRTVGLNTAEPTAIEVTATGFDATTNPYKSIAGFDHRLSSGFNGLGFAFSTGTGTGRYEVRAL